MIPSAPTGDHETFPNLPPFPNNVPTVPLLRLSLPLLRKSRAESERLWSASTSLGFFYLDLRGDPVGEILLKESDDLFKFGSELFHLGRETLEKYDYRSIGSYYGYKGFGKGVVDSQGGLDRNEFYNIPKDDFHSISKSPLAHPILLQHHAPLIRSYMTHSHALLATVLDELSSHLSLPPHILRDIHDQTLPSGDHIRLVKSPPNPSYLPLDLSMGAHTDFGSLTLLINRLGGLQVLSPDSSSPSWQYVRPLPGHAIINLGDALVKFTNGLLKSNIHRVVAPPGEQAVETRYSLVYFMRPGDDVSLKRLEGSKVIPGLADGVVEENVRSAEWIRDKAFASRVGVNGKGKKIVEGRETSALAGGGV